MKHLHLDNDLPAFEGMHTKVHERREGRNKKRHSTPMCIRKNGYTRKVALMKRAEGMKRGVQLWVYKCTRCKLFHLTHHKPYATR